MAAPVTVMRLHPLTGGALAGAATGVVMTGVLRAGMSLQRRRAEAAKRTLFVKRRPSRKRRCPNCGGFGIVRCHLCKGSGFVERQTPVYDVLLCPACVSHRYLSCGVCWGTGRRINIDVGMSRARTFFANFGNQLKGVLGFVIAKAAGQ